MNDGKLHLTTRKGLPIPVCTLEEAVRQCFVHSCDESGHLDIEKLSPRRYTALTNSYSLPGERSALISTCEQMRQKPYIVIYQVGEQTTRAAVYIPKSPKQKVVF